MLKGGIEQRVEHTTCTGRQKTYARDKTLSDAESHAACQGHLAQSPEHWSYGHTATTRSNMTLNITATSDHGLRDLAYTVLYYAMIARHRRLEDEGV